MAIYLSNLFPTTKEGIQAMTLEDYIGVFSTEKGTEILNTSPFIKSYTLLETEWLHIKKSHTFLTQEFRDIEGDWAFAGKWKMERSVLSLETDNGWKQICTVFEVNSYNDIIRESTKQGIKLYFLDREV